METTPSGLLARLHDSESARFPKAAIQEIIARRDKIIPHRIAVLESIPAAPAEYLDGPQVMLPTDPAYLLAQFRETRAYRPLLALLTLEGDLPEQFFGDSIPEDMHTLAISRCRPQRPLPLRQRPQVQEMLRRGLITRSFSNFVHGRDQTS
jgi:hypothetical protein